MAPVPRGRTPAVSYADSLCFWSPTGEHLYQLADLDLGRGRHTVVDQCRDCGDPGVSADTDRPSPWVEGVVAPQPSREEKRRPR